MQHRTSELNLSSTTLMQYNECDFQSLIVQSNEQLRIKSLSIDQSILVTAFLCPSRIISTFGGVLVTLQRDMVPSLLAQHNFDLSLFANFTITTESRC